jgi:hypothetical protein
MRAQIRASRAFRATVNKHQSRNGADTLAPVRIAAGDGGEVRKKACVIRLQPRGRRFGQPPRPINGRRVCFQSSVDVVDSDRRFDDALAMQIVDVIPHQRECPQQRGVGQ